MTLVVLTGAAAILYFVVLPPVFGSTAGPSGAPDELTWGKDPGLGVRDLHKAGYTGKGVTVAYIDQPIHLSHEQYSEADIHYEQVWTEDKGMQQSQSSMHGPAVVSLLLGKEIGIAPDVTLYYVAFPSWRTDQRAHADAIRKVIEQNQALPEGQKIRLITFSDGARVVPVSMKPQMFDTLDDLISRSTLVVTGEVIDMLPAPQPEKSPVPITEVVFKVDQVFKGEVTTPTIKVYQLGGRVGDFEYQIEGMRYYEQGERLLLFLEYAVDDLYAAISSV